MKKLFLTSVIIFVFLFITNDAAAQVVGNTPGWGAKPGEPADSCIKCKYVCADTEKIVCSNGQTVDACVSDKPDTSKITDNCLDFCAGGEGESPVSVTCDTCRENNMSHLCTTSSYSGSQSYCQNGSGAGGNCTLCQPNNPSNPPQPTNTPKPTDKPNPTNTPAPTIVPACNVNCQNNKYCESAKDGCTVCLPSSSSNGGKTCQTPPTPTTKPTNTPTPTSTPTPTPTPFPFSDNMCKCDGIEIGQIAAGQDLKVTAYGKVEEDNTKYAKITSFSFFAAKGNAGSPDITIFNKSGPIASEIVSTSQNLVRNKASWTFKFPGNPEEGAEYRIWNQIKCERNTTGTLGVKTSQKVLAEETQNQSFVQRFLSFFMGIFGRSKNSGTGPTPTGFLVTTQSDNNDQLQLGTFKFGRIVPDPATACYMVKIQFDN